MKLNQISGWREKWLFLAICWFFGVLIFKNIITDGILFQSLSFEHWYPVLKAAILPVVAVYFCIDLYRYAFGSSKNQLT